jgi:tetratricopeptide (TPR) repeat protein
MDVTRMNESINDEPQHFGEDDTRPEERRNAVVELLVKIADCHVAYDNYDEAAASFERALISHVAFRKLAENKLSGSSEKLNLDTRLPTATTKTTSIPLDLANATTAEAAIRNNLAYALTRINQEKLALDQYEMALQIKRHIGGNNHVEVGRTLMEMGALLGGPMKDLAAALNCFKEALHIYRVQRDEIVQANSNREENSRQAFYDADLELDEINEHVQNASKNIALIEDALLQHKGGVSKPRRP